MMLQLYHYTDEEAYHAIMREGIIRAGSRNKYGRGVYFTDLDPREHDREEVAKANYGIGAPHFLKRGRLDHYIQIHIPSHDVQRKTHNTYLYPRNMLRLRDYSLQNAGSNKDQLSDYSLKNAGPNKEWIQRSTQAAIGMAVAGGAVAVIRLCQAIDGWYSNWSNQQDQRMREVERKLADTRAVMLVGGGMAVAAGAVAVVRLCQAVGGWYSHRRSQQDQRTRELERKLFTTVLLSARLATYTIKRSGFDGVCICCQQCQTRVTADYRGGVLWADDLDLREVNARLSKHDKKHVPRSVAPFVGVALIGIGWMIVKWYS
jgi:hypothetical protein